MLYPNLVLPGPHGSSCDLQVLCQVDCCSYLELRTKHNELGKIHQNTPGLAKAGLKNCAFGFWTLFADQWRSTTRLRICRCWMFIQATRAKAWCWNLSHAASVGSLKFANGSTIRTQSCKYQTDVKVDLKLYKFTAFKALKDKEMNHSGTRMGMY